MNYKISIILLLINAAINCEHFYRPVHDLEKNSREPNCWKEGRYFDESLKKCTNFPRIPTAVEILDFARYREEEIKYICQQLWLVYSKELKFCIKDHSYHDYMNQIEVIYPVHRIWLKSKDNANESEIQQIDKYNKEECLRGGMVYDSFGKNCKFIKINPMEGNKIEEINNILTEELRVHIWSDICRQKDEIYNPSLKMCIKLGIYNAPKVSVYPDRKYSGKYSDPFERRLFCALIGREYLEENNNDACILYDSSKQLQELYEKYKHIYIHAKEVICAQFGMLYQREVDICYQTEEIEVKRKKRYIDLCLDPRCEQQYSTAEYGPNLYLLVSKKDEECFKQGLHYAKAYDRCEMFPTDMSNVLVKAYMLRYLPHLHKMLRSHCFQHNLDYSKHLRFCVYDQLVTHREFGKEELIRTNLKFYREREWLKCIHRGLDYNPVKDECIPYEIDLNSDSIKYYQKYHEKQLQIASHELNLTLKHPTPKLTSERIIKSYCANRNQIYFQKIGVCMESIDKTRSTMRTYTDLVKQHCLNKGELYNSLYDACIKSQADIEISEEDHLKTMCAYLNQEYDPQFGFCVMRRKSYEKATPPIPEIDSGDDGYEVCLGAGMAYNQKEDKCEYFPHKMDKAYIKSTRKVLRKYIDRFYEKFCNAANQLFDNVTRGCSEPLRYSKTIKIGLKQYSTPISYDDRFYCFLAGLTLYHVAYRQWACDPIPLDVKARETIRRTTESLRKMYIHHRCPIYSTYDDRIQFCIRRPQKEYKLRYTTKNTTVRYTLYHSKTYYSDDKGLSILRRREVDDEKCCMSKGLTWSTLPRHNVCLNYRIKPTPAELKFYKEDTKELRKQLLIDYCHMRKLVPHVSGRYCTYMDPF